ncbi:serine hydrolase [Candidatus Bipolaricaulota bacterium]
MMTHTLTPRGLKRWFHSNRGIVLSISMIALLAVSTMMLGCDRSGTPEKVDADTASLINPVDSEALARFESKLESLREGLKIPGISAAIVRDQELVWSQGFGFANVEEQIEATANTPYGLASVTKPFAAFLLMKKVEEGFPSLASTSATMRSRCGIYCLIHLRAYQVATTNTAAIGTRT